MSDPLSETSSNTSSISHKSQRRTRSSTRKLAQLKFHKKMTYFKPTMNHKNSDSNESFTSNDNDELDLKLIKLKDKINALAEEHKIDKIKSLNNKIFKLLTEKLHAENKSSDIKDLEHIITSLKNECEVMKLKSIQDNSRIQELINENEVQINEYIESQDKNEQEIANLKKLRF